MKKQLREVFSPSDCSSSRSGRVSGQSYLLNDKFCRSEVLSMGNNGSLRLPNSLKHSLSMDFGYLVLQIFIPGGKQFSLEFAVETSGDKKTLQFTHSKYLAKGSSESKVSNHPLARDRWANICIDLPSFATDRWKSTFCKVDRIEVSGNCRIRRIFALNVPLDHTVVQELFPREYQFPDSLSYVNQTINSKTLTTQTIRETVSFVRKEHTPQYLVNTEKARGRTGLNKLVRKKESVFRRELAPLRYTEVSMPALHKNRRAKNIFYQEAVESPEPMLKALRPGFFDRNFLSLTKIRHETPPLVHAAEGLSYDPVHRSYFFPLM